MADRLLQVLQFVNVPDGGQATIAHQLNARGVALIPDLILPSALGFSVISATSTELTVQNDSGVVASADFLLWFVWSAARVLGAVQTTALPVNPFIAVGGGAAGATIWVRDTSVPAVVSLQDPTDLVYVGPQPPAFPPTGIFEMQDGQLILGRNVDGSPMVTISSFGGQPFGLYRFQVNLALPDGWTQLGDVISGRMAPTVIQQSGSAAKVLVAGNNNDLNPGATGDRWVTPTITIVVPTPGGCVITGFDASLTAWPLLNTTDGAQFFLENHSANTFSLAHLSAASSVNNRIECPGGVSYVVPTFGSVLMKYSSLSNKWRPVVG